MSKLTCSVFFAGKQDDEHCDKALRFCRANFGDVAFKLGQWGDPRPAAFDAWRGDYIISYLSRWVIPEPVLRNARIAAVNFHPAPPEYPGIGCINFALYDEAPRYGVTCHHMVPDVDTGDIIAVRRFPLSATDDVASLLAKTYDCQFALFEEILGMVLAGRELPASEEKWARRPFTRKEFNDLCKITPDMNQEEIRRRIRATRYEKWGPFVELGGYRFELTDR